MPLSPVNPFVRRQAAGDTLVGWTRRSRIGWTWLDGTGVPLGEEREAYRIAWPDSSAETAAPVFTYRAALRGQHVAAGLGAVTLAVRQVGDAAVSPPLSITIDLR